ncbi:30S ribosomal protein S20 [Candidatus Roizmanbacteria bacterium]|nr:30S ribosomal protein S20 [Candidatus Roizmanbacteria bacterium]
MPVIKSAEKKLRQDKRSTKRNKDRKMRYKSAIKETKQKATTKTIAAAYSLIDTAAKKNIIHKNKAARLKRQIAGHEG